MMFGSIRLGTLWGVPVGVNWSVLLIAWLLAWGLAEQALPGQAPGLEAPAYWAAAAVVAALFFLSLLAHEMAHAVVARREGLAVEGITLWLLGGVARMRGEARTPGAEARIAGVGPLTSLVLAVGYGALAVGISTIGTGELVGLAAVAAAWLAVVNLVLAVFNLLPGAPLDGGRLAMAVLWRLRGDRLEATRLSTGLGQLLGYGLVGFGLVELVVGADLGGLWSIVLGIFLSSAASAERRGAEEGELLADIRVGEVMTRDPMRVPGTLTVDTFVSAALGQGRASTWLLTGPGGVVTGVLPIDRLAGVRGSARATTRLESVALPLAELPVTAEDERLLDLLERLSGSRGSRALVLAEGELVGLVTPEDVARAVQVARLRGQPGGSSGASSASRSPGMGKGEDPALP